MRMNLQFDKNSYVKILYFIRSIFIYTMYISNLYDYSNNKRYISIKYNEVNKFFLLECLQNK